MGLWAGERQLLELGRCRQAQAEAACMWGLWAAGGGWQAGVSHVVTPILAGTWQHLFTLRRFSWLCTPWQEQQAAERKEKPFSVPNLL